METSWEEQIDEFWDQFDGERPQAMLAEMRQLMALRGPDDGAGLYEWGGVHDSLGRTGEAIALYRRAIAAGLDDERRPQAALQLASSLRAEGDAEACLAVLDDWEATGTDASAVVGEAPSIVRALALHDLGKSSEALRTALLPLAATLPRYRRSMAAYAQALTDE